MVFGLRDAGVFEGVLETVLDSVLDTALDRALDSVLGGGSEEAEAVFGLETAERVVRVEGAVARFAGIPPVQLEQ